MAVALTEFKARSALREFAKAEPRGLFRQMILDLDTEKAETVSGDPSIIFIGRWLCNLPAKTFRVQSSNVGFSGVFFWDTASACWRAKLTNETIDTTPPPSASPR